MYTRFYPGESQTQELFTSEFLRLSAQAAAVRKSGRKHGLSHGSTTTYDANGPTEQQYWKSVQVYLDIPKKHKRTPGQRAALWGMSVCYVISGSEAR